jgi:predicted nucleic acid-binding protein
MIVLDTNVLSELMRAKPDGAVIAWMQGQTAATVYTTSITQAEILHGLLLLPAGKRREAIREAAEEMFAHDFADRILPFDSAAAQAYADIASQRRKAGRPISQFDAQIAAIVKSRGSDLATRNTSDFEGCGIKVLNPWR